MRTDDILAMVETYVRCSDGNSPLAAFTARETIRNAVEDLTIKCLPDGVMFDAFRNPRVRYVRVSYDGSHLILTPAEADEWKRDAEASAASVGQTDPHTYSDVYLSEVEADALPEFDGF
jgi:hypothetical protein